MGTRGPLPDPTSGRTRRGLNTDTGTGEPGAPTETVAAAIKRLRRGFAQKGVPARVKRWIEDITGGATAAWTTGDVAEIRRCAEMMRIEPQSAAMHREITAIMAALNRRLATAPAATTTADAEPAKLIAGRFATHEDHQRDLLLRCAEIDPRALDSPDAHRLGIGRKLRAVP